MPKGLKLGGRAVGTPNKATADARAAIASFVDGNAHRLVQWLDAVANGDPENYRDPNPAKAFELFQSVIEYHVPKLARTEIAGDADAPIKVEHNVSAFGELLKNIKLQRQSEE
jgi:hypothetical protein